MEHISEAMGKMELQPKYSLREVADSYKHIELTEDEKLEAEIWAKQKKENLLKSAELKRREEENRKMFSSGWTFSQIESYMHYRAGNLFKGQFKLDEYNDFIFRLLCYYFTEDEAFVKLSASVGVKNPSLSKGIMLAGNFGVGKTWLMKLFSKNIRQVFHIKNAKEIADSFESGGEEIINDFIFKHRNPLNDSDAFNQPFAGLCIDDLGTESLKNHFGNKKNVIGDIVELRYNKGNTGIFFHATTNLSAQQLNDFYGGRVVSRMREIFNFIELTGQDRRV